MISFWVGLGVGCGLVAWTVSETPGAANLIEPAAVTLILGGVFSVAVTQCGIPAVFAAIKRAFQSAMPQKKVTSDVAIAEVMRLAKKAQAEGGVLALRGEGEGFAEGFLSRTVNAAISAGETQETRRIMEAELRQLRQERLGEAEVFTVMAASAPILGLMGTLLGMVRVVGAIADPVRMGPAMAVALSSDFIALGYSQLICSPIAGRLIAETREEMLVREIFLEGVLGIVAGRPVYRLELFLNAYVRRKERRGGTIGGAAVTQGAAA